MKTKKYYDSKRRTTTRSTTHEERKKYRAFLNKKNRQAGKYGNGDGKDYDHDERRFMSAVKNRSKK
jgi:hypothetical protein